MNRRTSRERTRVLAISGSIAAAVVFASGVAFMIGGLGVYGDWYSIRLPWADLGMTTIVVGLAAAGLLGLLRAVVERWGWRTVAALPGLAITGFFWVAVLVMPMAGGCCADPGFPRNAGVILYSAPGLIGLLAVASALIHAPFVLARPAEFGWRR